jgi:hypothetical protein
MRAPHPYAKSPIAFLDGDRAMSGYGGRPLPYEVSMAPVTLPPPQVVTCPQAEADQISQEHRHYLLGSEGGGRSGGHHDVRREPCRFVGKHREAVDPPPRSAQMEPTGLIEIRQHRDPADRGNGSAFRRRDFFCRSCLNVLKYFERTQAHKRTQAHTCAEEARA